MQIKSLTAVLMVLIVISSAVISCTNTNHEKIATNAVDNWTSENIASIAEDISSAIISKLPVTDSTDISLVQVQTSDYVTWNYTTPTKISDNLYTVVLHTLVPIDIPQTGSYEIYIDFQLTVDTAQEKVTSSNIDLGSFNAVRE